MKKLFIFFAAFAVLAAGCSNLNLPENKIAPKNGAGTVQVNLGAHEARTLLPSTAELYYTLTFTSEGKAQVDETLDLTAGGNPQKPVTLEVATWALAVKAYLTEADATNPVNAVASGNVAEIVVTDGGTTPAQVKLTGTMTTGTGSLSYTISFPDTVTTATLLYGVIGGAVTELNLLTAGTPVTESNVKTVSGSIDVNAGYYQIGIYLADGDTETAKREVAQIYDKLDTAVEYTFVAGDFAVIPTVTVSSPGYSAVGTLDQMKSLIASAATAGSGTSSANPIVVKVIITDASLLSGTNEVGTDPLHKLFDAIPNGKYVSYDLSDSTFTSFEDTNYDGGTAHRAQNFFLSSITFPDTLTTIGAEIFVNCVGLTSVIIPDGVTSIGSGAFWACQGLTSISIPDSVISIGESAFYATGLTSVTIPDSVTSIGSNPFGGCNNLDTIQVDANNAAYTAIAGVLFNKSGTELIAYPARKGNVYTIPNSVTSIGDRAFYQNNRLTSITIPGSVTSIGGNAFLGCNVLTSVSIPDSVTSIGSGAFFYCIGLTSVSIPDSVTSIGSDAFYNCSGLTSVYISRSTPTLTTLGGNGFDNTHASLAIYVPAGVVGAYKAADGWSDYASRIQAVVFITAANLDQMKSLVAAAATAGGGTSSADPIGVKVTIADASLLSGTNSGGTDPLHKLFDAIPNGKYVGYDLSGSTFTSIGDRNGFAPDARTNIPFLSSITLPNTLTSIGYGVFQNCNGLTSFTIPDNVISIDGVQEFYGCTGLISFYIGKSLSSISGDAFSFCFGLTTITVDSDNAYFSSQDGVLFNKDKTTLVAYPVAKNGSYSIPSTVTTIGYYAFFYCNSLTSITIPDSVTTIDVAAFANCSALTSITIGNGVTSIGSDAFYNCSGLTSVYILRSTPTLTTLEDSNVFRDHPASLVIYVPTGVVDAYKVADGWSTYASRIQAAP